MKYKYDLCPVCGQGELYDAIVNATGESVIVCDECEALWEGNVATPTRDNSHYLGTYLKERSLSEGWQELEVDLEAGPPMQ